MATTTGLIHPVCPDPVRWPAQMHRWEQLTFLHWGFDPAVVQRLLPPGLEVDTFDGAAWVGLVPFHMTAFLPGGPPPMPWVSHFPETNVRTYARAPDGTAGVWFLSLDAARLGAVLTARVGFRLPYYWSNMAVLHAGDVISYRSRRRWPGPRGATSEAAIAIGAAFRAGELGNFDHWLTARWRLFSVSGSGRLRYVPADHPPWVLHHADVLHLDDGLLNAAGLPRPERREPIAHYAPGVEVRIGMPHALRLA